MKGAVLTDSKLRSLANSYPKYLTYNKEKGKIGTVCTDCSGLISWCTGKVRGSSQYKETATRIEPISNINGAVAGCALWQQGHIGIYIGNGECIEARGSAYGTVKTKVANRKFTHILWLCDIDYDKDGCINEGTRVTVKEWSNGWARIPSGWVSGKYLRKV